MAYMDQEKKAEIKKLLKQAIPARWKWTLGVRHYSTIVLTISTAPVDLLTKYIERESAVSDDIRRETEASRYIDVNPYYWREHFTGDLLVTFGAIFAALNLNNHDNSDIQTDYFDVGHYVNVKIGKWDKPFQVLP